MGILILMTWIAVQAMQVAEQKPTQLSTPLTVCDILAEDPTKWNGKVVSVRGLFTRSDEGMWLFEECKKHLVTKNLAWSNTLWLEFDTSDQKFRNSWDCMLAELDRLHARIDRDRVWMTLVGRLETRPTMDDAVVQMPYGPMRAGFGHMGGSPAAFNVLSVEDVKLEKSQNKRQRPGEK